MKYTAHFLFLCVIGQAAVITAANQVALAQAQAKETAEIRAKRIHQRLLALTRPINDDQAKTLNYRDAKSAAVATQTTLPEVLVATIMKYVGQTVQDVPIKLVASVELNLRGYEINCLDGLLDISGIQGILKLDLSRNALSETSDFTSLKELPYLRSINLLENELRQAPPIAADMPQLKFILSQGQFK
jgi:hypothetical protein